MLLRDFIKIIKSYLNYKTVRNSSTQTKSNNNEIGQLVNSVSNLTAVQNVSPCPLSAPLVVTFVGLPCRGKSLAAHKIARHLCWKGEFAKVFQVENNANAETFSEIIAWFQEGNNVAIIDGMHLTRQSRQAVSIFCTDRSLHHLLVEFNCDEQSLEENIAETSHFYQNFDKHMNWSYVCREKIKQHAAKYEPCQMAIEGPLIQVHNSENPLVHSVTARGVQGALQTSILGKLSSPVIKHQLYYFSRHGESDYNVLGRIGGDADLSARGKCYAERLKKYFATAPGVIKPQMIWTSELQRTIHTAQNISGAHVAVKDLNEINAGICEGLTYEEIHERFPQEFAWRDQDKLKYRYPHGESYLDLLQRVDSVVQALLTQSEVLVVSHQAVLRCIMAYFKGSKPDEVPYIDVPLHTLLVVRSYGYEFTVETVPLKVECVDTYRIRPKNCSPDRKESDVLETVPAHFDAPLPQII